MAGAGARSARRRWAAAKAALAALAILAVGAYPAPAGAAGGWGAPFPFTAPGSMDLIDAQAAFAPRGAAAVAYGVQDVDRPGVSQAYLAIRSASGALGGPWPIRGAQEVLSLGYDAGALELLTGAGSAARACCSRVQAVRLTARGVLQRPRTLVAGLAGAALGRLLTLTGGGMVAAVAGQQGVWVAQSRRADRFAPAHRLTTSGQMPQALAAAWLGGRRTIVAWTAAIGSPATAAARTIQYALGGRSGAPAPARAQTLLTVPRGHRVDQLVVARRGSGATVGWVESWFGRGDAYRSVVRVAEVGSRPIARTLSSFFEPAFDPQLAADPGGDQAIAWQLCRSDGSCTVQVARRRARAGRFGRPFTLGPIDPGQEPSLDVGGGGRTIAVWPLGGQPVAAVGSAAGGRFAAPLALSSTVYAYDPTVVFGPGRAALAVWSQGTLNPSVVGAVYRVP